MNDKLKRDQKLLNHLKNRWINIITQQLILKDKNIILVDLTKNSMNIG